MPWVAPAIAAAGAIGSAAIGAMSKGGGSDNSSSMTQQSLTPAMGTLTLANQMQNKPWNEIPYPNMNQGWWNTSGSPPTTQIPGYQNFQFQNFGQAAPTYQRYAGADPTYQGLENGDYTRLEDALRTPGELAAKNAFQSQTRSLNDTLGGRGAYGSSGFTRSMNNDAWSNYLNTLATNSSNAVAQRYGMQQTDLGRQLQANLTGYQGRMSENQAANNQAMGAWSALLGENNLKNQLGFQDNTQANQYGMQQAMNQNTINQLPWQWDVTKGQGLWNALLGQQQWNSGQRDSTFGNIQNFTRMFDPNNAQATGTALDQNQQRLDSGNSLGGPLGTMSAGVLGQTLGSTNWSKVFGSSWSLPNSTNPNVYGTAGSTGGGSGPGYWTPGM